MAAAYLDDLLEVMLREHFAGGRKVADDLLSGNGPLAPFSARIKLAFSLRLIREDQFNDLERIRKIRNEFAHGHQGVSFDSQPIRDLCDSLDQLNIVKQFEATMSPADREFLVDQFKSRRERFIGNTVHLAVGLMIRARGDSPLLFEKVNLDDSV
ncbi:MAG TPA: MltR family transcriptional regulator [Planctomycetaceae bacterium]|nr:MltR family transcriptional regulator [Planctomycetaceae bacterium]